MHGDTVMSLAGMGFVLVILALIVIIIVALIKVAQTKVSATKEEVYQKLAQDAIDTQEETARLNKELVSELKEVKARLTSIETILKEVE